MKSDKRDETSVHSVWKESRAIFSLGINWANDASTEEKTRKKRLTQDVSKRFTEIVGKRGGTYVNEANPSVSPPNDADYLLTAFHRFEPDWKQVFWGDKYEKLLKIKKRVDPKGLFKCNRCVGGAVVLSP